MNGVIYPEISNMSNAAIGGYLSTTAASNLLDFKTRASRPRYMTDTFTAAHTTSLSSGNNKKISFTVPTGYTTIGAVGGTYGQAGCVLAGYYASGTAGTIIAGGGTYPKNSTTPNIQILFERT